MKKITLIAGLVLAFASFSNAQLAYQRGTIQADVTEGNTFSNYTTGINTTAHEVGWGHFVGCRDPLSIEYGISNRFGIGLTSSSDYYMIDPSRFYGFSVANNQVKALASEFTIDGSYHFYVTRHWDIAGVLSFGSSTVSFSGNNGYQPNTDTYKANSILASDGTYNYNAKGFIVRTGLHARYFIGHLGFVAMFTAFNEGAQVQKEIAGQYTTGITGFAKEFGFCWRFKK